MATVRIIILSVHLCTFRNMNIVANAVVVKVKTQHINLILCFVIAHPYVDHYYCTLRVIS